MQSVLTSLGNKPELNPSLHAIHAAYTRRRFTGRFVKQGRSLDMDTLLHQDSKGARDDDTMALQKERQKKTSPSSYLCKSFQKGKCTFTRCRYVHQCAICDSFSHGAIGCNKMEPSQSGASTKLKPPHPRFRRDRAKE